MSTAKRNCCGGSRKSVPGTLRAWMRRKTFGTASACVAACQCAPPQWRVWNGSSSRPDFLEVPEHQRADVLQRRRLSGETGGIAPQERPVLAAENLLQVQEILTDGFHVRIAPFEQRLEVPVGALELAVEALGANVLDEVRRL